MPVNNPKAPVPSPMEEPAPIVNPKSTAKTDPFLEDLLAKHPNYFQRFLQQRDSFRLQIIYTQIDRKANNKPVFKDYYFNVNPDQYLKPFARLLKFQPMRKLGEAPEQMESKMKN